MLPPLICRPGRDAALDASQRGFTMAFVAITMVAILSMAALSIDIGTLYEAKAEAQRAADAGALAAAQVISTSGITGDPTNGPTDGSWSAACGASGLATLAATNVASQNLIGGNAASTVKVYYGTSSGVGTITDCTTVGAAFAVNPVVEVYVQQAKLPTFFARIFSLIPGGTFSNSGVSATAAAEAFNPSSSSPMVPVQPRCVKPWMVPNQDPGHGSAAFVDASAGSIQKPGLSASGVVGETFNLIADCSPLHRRRCHLNPGQPVATPPITLQYVPAQTSNASGAIAANTSISGCSQPVEDTNYWNAVAGCDQATVYACGTPLANTVDLTSDNPGLPGNDSVNATQCLINATDASPSGTTTNGQDYLDPGAGPYTYPFVIREGSNSALIAASVASGSQITSSPSVVSLPIYDNSTTLTALSTTPVTVIGFLQVFINSVDSGTGNINVTVMNVAGCGNSATKPAVAGTSPVPVRLITPPVVTP